MGEGNTLLSLLQPSPKRSRVSATTEYNYNGQDRISLLPDDILVLILDKLPMDAAQTTSLLAKRWKGLWKYKNNIFLDKTCPKRTCDIMCAARRYLKNIHKGQKIERFCVSSRCDEYSIPSVQDCIVEAVKKKAQEIHINLNGSEIKTRRKRPDFNLLPDGCTSSCSTLTKLTLHFMKLVVLPSSLTNLRELYLGQVELAIDAVERITVNCPLLILLSLSNCNVKSDLKVIISPMCGLQKLIIKEELVQVAKKTDLYLSAPSLTSIKFVSALPRKKYQVGPLPMVKEAKFNLDQMRHDRRTHKVCKNGLIGKQFRLNFLGLLRGCKNAGVLSLNSWCIQIIGAEMIFRKRLCSFGATHLVLETGLSTLELMGVVGLLRACQEGLTRLSIFITEPQQLVLFHRSLFRDYFVGSKHGKLDFDGSESYDALKGMPKLEVVEFKNCSAHCEIPDDGTFDEGRFFIGTESGPMAVFSLMEKAKNLRKLTFASRKRVFEVNLHAEI